ncbi:hypothetical protein GWI33_012706 [Rhynchophorus ferrugineus]|uniref:Uncharacterized protein n=1 Tax=Rhynchophorus ferrugineus TaxID=354439 RepID=A0A834II92_RHYFE|nr:hypothetical protein GWI33_012706 [Rhynchophorus ferrugineus]
MLISGTLLIKGILSVLIELGGLFVGMEMEVVLEDGLNGVGEGEVYPQIGDLEVPPGDMSMNELTYAS